MTYLLSRWSLYCLCTNDKPHGFGRRLVFLNEDGCNFTIHTPRMHKKKRTKQKPSMYESDLFEKNHATEHPMHASRASRLDSNQPARWRRRSCLLEVSTYISATGEVTGDPRTDFSHRLPTGGR